MMLILQANILVDKNFHACLADFGLATILTDSTFASHAQRNIVRWMSPELCDPEKHYELTKYSDCYAFGMVIYEVLAKRVPFYEYTDLAVRDMVLQGDRPEKPEGMERTWFTADVWGLLERCWSPESQNRPSIEDVLQNLEEASRSWSAPSPTRLLAIPSTAGSSAGWFLGQSTEGGNASGMPSSSKPVLPQSQEEPEQEDSAGVARTVCWENPLCEF